MNSNSVDIEKALDNTVRYYGQKVSEYLNSNKGKYPSGQDAYRKNYKTIQDSEKIGSVQTTAEGYSQTISYGGVDAPYATAYEFGTPEYVINAKSVPMAVGKATLMRGRGGWKPVNRAGALASKKSRGLAYLYNKKVPELEIFLFSSVDHPKFAPRPYAQTVLTQEQDTIVKKVGQEVFISITKVINQL